MLCRARHRRKGGDRAFRFAARDVLRQRLERICPCEQPMRAEEVLLSPMKEKDKEFISQRGCRPPWALDPQSLIVGQRNAAQLLLVFSRHFITIPIAGFGLILLFVHIRSFLKMLTSFLKGILGYTSRSQ